MNRPVRITLTIHELVLHGYSERQADQLHQALVSSLDRRAQADAATAEWHPSIQNETSPLLLPIDDTTPVELVGEQLAALIWEQIYGR